MEKGKKYSSNWKGSRYDIFVKPNDKLDAYSVSVYSGDEFIDALKGEVSDVKQALKEGTKIVVAYHKNKNNVKSSADGSENNKKKGTIRLAWLDIDKNDSIIHTQPFDSVAEALKAATKEKKKWLIFQSIDGNNDISSWELLPYGSYNDYRRGVNVTSNVIVKTTVVVLSLFGTYFLLTKLKPFIFKS